MKTAKITAKIGTVRKPAQVPTQPMAGAGSLVVMCDGALKEAITVRTYRSASRNASAVRACIWVHTAKNGVVSGRGEARGWQYHMTSEAIADAVRNAGLELFGDPYGHDASRNSAPLDFGGTGSSNFDDIFKAIARAAGYKGRMAWVSHGL